MVLHVEGLYCKRPIPSLASSDKLTPAFGAGEDTLARWREGGGAIVRKTPDNAVYSIYVSTL
jgi:hypothetical protein